jgi:thymidine phosphorylase
MLVLGKVARDDAEGRAKAQAAIADGRAAETMRRMISAQHGDPRVVDDLTRLPRAEVVRAIPAARAGWIVDVDPLALGLAGVEMGAGRTRAEQAVDPAVGIVLRATKGVRVEAGAPLCEVHVRSDAAFDAVARRIAGAFTVGDTQVARGPLILETIRGV